MSEPRHAVVLAEPDPPNLAAVARALAAFRGVPFQDAARMARGTWGIIAEDMAQADARRLVGFLDEAGLKGLALSADLLIVLPEPRPIVRAEFERAGLRAFAAGAGFLVPWGDLALIAAAGFQKAAERMITVKEGPTAGEQMANLGILLATGLPIKMGGGQRVVQKRLESSELVFYLDLYFGSPLERLRVDAQAFDYSCLKERMLPHALGNFRLLALELSARAPAALASRGLEAFEKGQPVNSVGYASLEDLNRESRWRLTLRSLRAS